MALTYTLLTRKGSLGKMRRSGEFAMIEEGDWRVEDDALLYDLELTVTNQGGVAQCSRLTIEQRPDGPPVQTDRLRFAIKHYVADIGDRSVFKLADPSKPGMSGGVEPLDVRELPSVRSFVAKERRNTRRRITDEDLTAFADVVRVARRRGRSYITEAQVALGLTSDQARQWKRKAIDGDFLEDDT